FERTALHEPFGESARQRLQFALVAAVRLRLVRRRLRGLRSDRRRGAEEERLHARAGGAGEESSGERAERAGLVRAQPAEEQDSLTELPAIHGQEPAPRETPGHAACARPSRQVEAERQRL